jgi:hypothetical protein
VNIVSQALFNASICCRKKLHKGSVVLDGNSTYLTDVADPL